MCLICVSIFFHGKGREHLNRALKKVFCKEHRALVSGWPDSLSPVEDGGGEPGSEVVGSAEQISLGWSAIFWQVLHIHQNVWSITGEGTWRLKGHLWDLGSQWNSVALYALTGLSRKAVVRGLSGTGLDWAGWWGMRFTSVGLKTSAKTWERCEALLHVDCISTFMTQCSG